MPRENPEGDRIINPAKKFWNWNGDKGHFEYYDKEAKKNITVTPSAKTPFIFLPLRVLATVKGFCAADNSGYTSNEVSDTTQQPFTVNTWTNKKANLKAVGVWNDISEKIKSGGGKFSRSVYAAMKVGKGKELEIVNIQMYGAALGAWSDYTKENKIYESAVVIKEVSNLQKKGKITWYFPIMKSLKVTPETDDAAGVLQKELKVYHDAYFARNASVKSETAPVEDVLSGTTEKYKASDNAKKVAAANTGKQTESVAESEKDIDFDDFEEVPF